MAEWLGARDETAAYLGWFIKRSEATLREERAREFPGDRKTGISGFAINRSFYIVFSVSIICLAWCSGEARFKERHRERKLERLR